MWINLKRCGVENVANCGWLLFDAFKCVNVMMEISSNIKLQKTLLFTVSHLSSALHYSKYVLSFKYFSGFVFFFVQMSIIVRVVSSVYSKTVTRLTFPSLSTLIHFQSGHTGMSRSCDRAHWDVPFMWPGTLGCPVHVTGHTGMSHLPDRAP